MTRHFFSFLQKKTTLGLSTFMALHTNKYTVMVNPHKEGVIKRICSSEPFIKPAMSLKEVILNNSIEIIIIIIIS